jgi:hypothetical protein
MFSLPGGEQPPEGTSDANPIVLLGDTVADFRHFLWSLYALYVLMEFCSSTLTSCAQALGAESSDFSLSQPRPACGYCSNIT